MDVTHALAAGMGGIRTAGDLVARMQMSRGMRLKEAKEYVAGKLGCTVRDLSDSYAMEQIRGEKGLGRILDHSNLHPGEPNAMMAKFRIAELLGIRINSVEKFQGPGGAVAALPRSTAARRRPRAEARPTGTNSTPANSVMTAPGPACGRQAVGRRRGVSGHEHDADPGRRGEQRQGDAKPARARRRASGRP